MNTPDILIPVPLSSLVGGGLQKVSVTGQPDDYRYQISANGQAVAIMSRLSNGVNSTRYLLRDGLGSVTKITDSSGAEVVSESFSAFGTRRNPSTWSGMPTNGDQVASNGVTRDGYTGQDALGSLGLNHMNGRVQDAITGRFLSADPYVTEPDNTQSYNRYSYVMNNPLSFIDPSGFGECIATPGSFGDTDPFPEVGDCGHIEVAGEFRYSPFPQVEVVGHFCTDGVSCLFDDHARDATLVLQGRLTGTTISQDSGDTESQLQSPATQVTVTGKMRQTPPCPDSVVFKCHQPQTNQPPQEKTCGNSVVFLCNQKPREQPSPTPPPCSSGNSNSSRYNNPNLRRNMRYGATGGAFAGGVLVFAVVVNIVGFPEAEIAEGMVGTAALFEVASAEPFVSAGTLALSGAAAGGTVGAMTAYGFTSPIPCK